MTKVRARATWRRSTTAWRMTTHFSHEHWTRGKKAHVASPWIEGSHSTKWSLLFWRAERVRAERVSDRKRDATIKCGGHVGPKLIGVICCAESPSRSTPFHRKTSPANGPLKRAESGQTLAA